MSSMTGGTPPPSGSLPTNAYMIPRADNLKDPSRGWYFSVLVRASMLRMEMMNG